MSEEPRRRAGRRTSPGPREDGDNPPLPSAGDEEAPTPQRTRTRKPRATSPGASSSDAPSTARAALARTPRLRAGGAAGLGERARLLEQRPTIPLPDPLFLNAHGIHQALLHRPFDEALPLVAEGLVAALAPAVVQVWIADASPLAGGQGRIGGQELAPTLRLRTLARAASRAGDERASREGDMDTPAGSSSRQARPSLATDPLVEEVATARRPVVLYDADALALGGEWSHLLPTPLTRGAEPRSALPDASDERSLTLGTLAGYPLRTRGQFFGVLAVGTAGRLGVRHLTILEELADVAALAADRDRHLSYSRSQEALAQTVVYAAPVAIAVLAGPEHTFVLANPAFNFLLDLESDVSLTDQCLDEILPERAATLAASLRLDAVVTGGEPQMMIELPIRHATRGVTYWNITSAPLPALPGGAGGVLVAAVEVTRQVVSRQRSQEAAEVAQERVGQMLALHDTSLAVASQLGADPRELLADILRRSIALLGAHAGTVFVHDPRRGELEVIVSQGLRGDYTGHRIHAGEGLAGRVAQIGQGLYVDDYHTYPSRAPIYEDEDFRAVIAVPLIQRGQVVGVLNVLDDAERRAFTDDDLWLLELFAAQAAQAIENARTYVELERAYRKQRELDRMKDDFIATASHELRTPLTGIQGFIDLLLDFPGSRDDPLAVDFLKKAAESAQELAEISERLLQTSRLDTGRVELHLVPVRLATVVEEALRSFRALEQAQGGKHEMFADIPPDVYLLADLGRLKEVLDNLIGNAIKYSPQGGRVVVSCAPTAFGAEGERGPDPADEPQHIADRPTEVLPLLSTAATDPTNDPAAPNPAVVAAAARQRYIVIRVSDEGMGIAPGDRSQLFGRFARTEAARASHIRGTGLGLYICRQIIRAMDGDIWLDESATGKGSTFAFALPAALAEAGEAEEREAAWSRASSR